MHLAPPYGVTPSEFSEGLNGDKTRMIGRCMVENYDNMLSRFVFIQYRNVTDGQTDRQTDRHINIARQHTDAR